MRPLTVLLSFLFIANGALCNALQFISPANPNIIYNGRVDLRIPEKPRFSFPGVSIETNFEGSVCQLKIKHTNALENYYNVFIDDSLSIIKVTDGEQVIKLAEGLADKLHTLKIFKRTESNCGTDEFLGLLIGKGKKVSKPTINTNKHIEFIGNSITCGYGNEGSNKDCPFSPLTENNYLAYGAITARTLNTNYSAVSYSGKGVFMNYDQSTSETMPELFERTIANEPDNKWDFNRCKPDVVVINLGTNDFAHQNPDSIVFTGKYLNFLHRIKSVYPKAAIFCIMGPMISDYWPEGNKAQTHCSNYINAVVKASGIKEIYFYQLKQQGVYGYGCDWHPNVKQHETNAKELSKFIKEKMQW